MPPMPNLELTTSQQFTLQAICNDIDKGSEQGAKDALKMATKQNMIYRNVITQLLMNQK